MFARTDDAFYDDVLFVDERESFLGLITTQTLFKVQNALLRITSMLRALIEALGPRAAEPDFLLAELNHELGQHSSADRYHSIRHGGVLYD